MIRLSPGLVATFIGGMVAGASIVAVVSSDAGAEMNGPVNEQPHATVIESPSPQSSIAMIPAPRKSEQQHLAVSQRRAEREREARYLTQRLAQQEQRRSMTATQRAPIAPRDPVPVGAL